MTPTDLVPDPGHLDAGGAAKHDRGVAHMQLDGEPWAQAIPAGSSQPLVVRAAEHQGMSPASRTSIEYVLVFAVGDGPRGPGSRVCR